MEKTFIIQEVPQAFVWWIEAYGKAKQQVFTDPIASEVTKDSIDFLWHPVHRENKSEMIGWIRFSIQPIDGADTIKVTATPIGAEYRIIENEVDGGWEQERRLFFAKKIEPELKQYYQAMMTAIRRKWPSGAPRKESQTA